LFLKSNGYHFKYGSYLLTNRSLFPIIQKFEYQKSNQNLQVLWKKWG